MEALDIAIQFSDLFEATQSEGSQVAVLIDSEIMPNLTTLLEKPDGIGLGARFNKVLGQVRDIIGQGGGDAIRTLKEMMKNVLINYVKRTNDTITARNIFHNAIMQGQDTMLTITAAGLLSNALAGQHPREAMQLMQQVGSRLTGQRPTIGENASGAAVGAGSIAGVATGATTPKKRDKKSIFAEISWRDLQDQPPTINLLREIAADEINRPISGVLVDPTTAELVLATHTALSPDRRQRFEAKSVSEMIRIANRLFEQGGIELIVQEE
jgi:hypothetical protein